MCWRGEAIRATSWYGNILIKHSALWRCKGRPCARGKSIQAPREGGMQEILRAARAGNEGEVIRLLDADPTLLERLDSYGLRPLAVAAERGQLGLVRLLIQRGADLDATGGWGRVALHWAADEGHEEVVACLMHHGAEANRRAGGGVTPLMLACGSGHLGVVKMLVHYQGRRGLDGRDEDRWTALHWAAAGASEQVVRFLLPAGADPTITDNQGRTPRETAQLYAHRDQTGTRVARCVAVFEWWEGELVRRAVLCRATCLHKAYTAQRGQPTSQVPTYLEARVGAGHAVPFVEVVPPQSEGQQQQDEEVAGAPGKRKAAGERGDAQGAEAGEEETRHAVVEYVLKGLNEELVTELLEGFHK